VLLAALDAYVITTILVDINDSLHLAINFIGRLTAIVTGFLLGYVAAMPLLGQLSDRFGRRPLLHVCLAVFGLGSVVTALGDSIPWLVAGRTVQGLAGGALLPITMALVSDLWPERQRPVVLGAVGAVQELGSVLGPLYGAGIALTAMGWRGIFWINVPLVLLAMAAVQLTVPGGSAAKHAGVRTRIDLVGGLLLAAGLSLVVIGVYNPGADIQKPALPSYALPVLAAGAAVLVAFVVWEVRSETKLLDLSGVRRTPLFATLAVSLLSGAALMVTLWGIQLIVQTILNKRAIDGALALTWFLLTLVVVAIVSGLLVRIIGERWTAVLGMAVATVGYLLIWQWPVNSAAASYGAIPRMDADLVVAGCGLGLVIAPVSSAVLRSVPSAQHGAASATVVVARMMGMLLGVSSLSAWGFYRIHALTAHLDIPLPFGIKRSVYNKRLAAYNDSLHHALHTAYSEIFLITAILCAVGAVLALALPGRSSGAEVR
jgi:MFS family permease